MLPLISVIVPLYNSEKYLSSCINSILQQTYINFELLLIDDGSKDNSGKICDEYVLKDDRIKVFHTANQGSAMARNVGLDNAKGEYISMIDSDDLVPANYLELLINASRENNADIVGHFFKGFYNDEDVDTKKKVVVQKDNIVFYTKNEALHQLVHNYRTYLISPVKLYKSSIFKDIRYPCVKKNDDEWVIHRILLTANKFAVIEERIYYYRFSPTGQTRNFSLDNFSGVLAALDRANTLQLNGYGTLVLQAYINFFNRMIAFCNEGYKHKMFPKKEIKSIRRDLKYACKLIIQNADQNTYSCKEKIAIFLFTINYKWYRMFVKMFSINLI